MSRRPLASPRPRSTNALALLLSLTLAGAHGRADDELDFASARGVNEGHLRFLATAPVRVPHHHQNRIVIDADSLVTGWVGLVQCHDHLDAVPRAQITFRDDHVRDLRVEHFENIDSARVDGASVQLIGIQRGARLCLSAETRALRDRGDGIWVLQNGPYLRRFLDGYYPMRVSLQVEYPVALMTAIDVSPAPQPGVVIETQAGAVRLDTLFEGELTTRIQFQRKQTRRRRKKIVNAIDNTSHLF